MGLESLGEKQDGAGGLGFCSWIIWASRARQRGPGLERGVARGSGRLAEVQAGTSGRRRPEDTCHLILVEALDGGAEGTAHEALGCIGVVQEADLQGDEPILQRQGLHDLMALPVPHVYVATIQPWGGGRGQRVGSGSGQGSGQNLPHSPRQKVEKPAGGIRKTPKQVRVFGTILYHHPKSWVHRRKKPGEGFPSRQEQCACPGSSRPLEGILTCLYISGVEAISKDIGSRPFSADHDIVSRLVPEVIAHRCGSPRPFPCPLHLKRLSIQQHKTP